MRIRLAESALRRSILRPAFAKAAIGVLCAACTFTGCAGKPVQPATSSLTAVSKQDKVSEVAVDKVSFTNSDEVAVLVQTIQYAPVVTGSFYTFRFHEVTLFDGHKQVLGKFNYYPYGKPGALLSPHVLLPGQAWPNPEQWQWTNGGPYFDGRQFSQVLAVLLRNRNKTLWTP